MQSSKLKVSVLVANDAARFAEEHLDGARISRIPTLGALSSMPITPTLPWNIARRKADIVHIHLPNPWAALALLMSGHRGKIVITHHGDTLGRKNLRKISDPFVVALMKRAAAIIVSSGRYLETSEELAGFRDRCRVIPLGLDRSAFESADPVAMDEIRQKYGDRLILSVGRMVPYKGIRYLIESMRGVDAHLLHIGTGPLEPELARQVLESGMFSKVHLLGRVDNLGPYLHTAKMLVLPSISRAESFGIVQLEAMAAGLPIVNTNIESGVPEVSLHGVTGLTVPPANTIALAAAISLLLDDPALSAKLGEAGQARVRREFSIERMAGDTMQVYSNVLNQENAVRTRHRLRLPEHQA